MKIDITLKITPKMLADAQGNEKKALLNKQVWMIGVDFADVTGLPCRVVAEI